MPENNKTKEFLQKLAPCIERGELEACVEEAARVAREIGIGAVKLSFLSWQMGECEKHNFAYTLALAAAPNLKWKEKAKAYSNAGLAAQYLGKLKKAEECFKQSIESYPKYAEANYNYAILLKTLERNEEAEKHYLLAIEANPKFAEAHSNYAILLKTLKRNEEAEKHYLLAIEANPKLAGAHLNYANLLSEFKRSEEAEKHYLLTIEANPKLAEAHGAYALLLFELDIREKVWDEIERASNLFKESGRITESYLAWAWFHELYSEKYFNMRQFPESGEEARKAGNEYLKAAETADGALKYNFSQQGNILKAKSFVRKVPKKYWYTKILYRSGGKRDIPGIINNLKQAASFYEKAAMCPTKERQDVCSACHTSISVFSDTLSVMEAFINKRSAEINKREWINKLDSARLIYEEKKMKNGVALVDTLKQLIKCIDEMAVHREGGLGIQKEKCGKCYNRLTEVSVNLDGALNVLAEHSIEAIREYAKKQGMSFVNGEPEKSSNWLIKAIFGAVGAIILGIIANRLFSWDLDLKLINFVKSITLGTP
ncbi:MAG: tetratricopeptide repeat protein [Candidatus Methanoperedens sp.]|nr:tetratricopeptide repeat protein [Candidatus Methanoperedens sp.]